MDLLAINESFTRVEIASLVAVAVIVGVILGPGAISVEGADVMWIEALSAVLTALFVFAVGAISLWASKQ